MFSYEWITSLHCISLCCNVYSWTIPWRACSRKFLLSVACQNKNTTFVSEGNGDKKYLRFPYIWDNNFEVMSSEIALYNFDLKCAETVKSKPTRNGSVFITYSNTIYFSVIWLDNIGCLIIQYQNFVKEQDVSWF